MVIEDALNVAHGCFCGRNKNRLAEALHQQRQRDRNGNIEQSFHNKSSLRQSKISLRQAQGPWRDGGHSACKTVAKSSRLMVVKMMS